MKNQFSNGALFTGSYGSEAYHELFALLERTTPSDYDRIMDAVYHQTSIGGGMHRTFDGSHTFHESWDLIKDKVGDVDVVEYISAHSNELVTPEGIPFFTLNKIEYEVTCAEVSDVLGGVISEGQVGAIIRDFNSVNAGEVVGAGLGSLFLYLAIRSGDSNAISRVVAANLCLGIATANVLQIGSGLAGLAYGVYHGKIASWELLKGAAPILSGSIAYQAGRHIFDLSKGTSFILSLAAGAAVTAVLAKLEADKAARVSNELRDNRNYITVMTPGLLSQALETNARRRPSLALGI